MDPEINKKIDELRVRIEAVYVSVEKTRKYMLITAWVTILVIVLPIIGLFFAIPAFIGNYLGGLNSLGL